MPARIPTVDSNGNIFDKHLPDRLQVDALVETIQDTISGSVVAGTNITTSYNDTAGTLTISSTATGTNIAPTYANLPAGTTLTVLKGSDGTWPVRPTNRTDIVVQWKGADPSPAIITSGTGGMLNNVDVRFVTS